MRFLIEPIERTAGGVKQQVYLLTSHDTKVQAEVWPHLGCNCLRWCVRGPSEPLDLLYVAPDWENNPIPTRSGIPVLFPFPNRIRDGRFRFRGKEYQLPLNDSTKKNAIHGFVPRRPWRVVGEGADNDGAWLQGEFRASIDAADALNLWPSDYRLTTTVRLGRSQLRYEFTVDNLGAEPCPFGLGMHPYLRFPYAKPDEHIHLYRLWAPAESVWLLEESLPTGEIRPVEADLDWNRPRFVEGTQLDTVYTRLGSLGAPAGSLIQRAEVRHGDFGGSVQVWCSPEFRESVLFTPAHRKAICIEPYTCATDAANLGERGIDAGWIVLEPGSRWNAQVEFRWDPYATEFFKVK